MNIGAELRRAREARGLSVEALAATTRIQVRVLDGIERNDLSVIPPRPYARGFVAAYAREVGLSPDQTVRAYFAQFEAHDTGASGEVPAVTDAGPADRRPAMALMMVTLLAIAAAVMLWRPDAGTGSLADVVGTTGTGMVATAGLEPAVDRTAEPAPVRALAPPTVPAREQIVAVLEAERAAWIAATADGERVLYRIVQAGATETVRARREITIRVGDAGAVRLSVNGGPAAPLGRDGQVRDVTLTPAVR